MRRFEISTIVAFISVLGFFWLIMYHSSYVTKANKEKMGLETQIGDLEVNIKEKIETVNELNSQLVKTSQRLREVEIEIASLEMDKQSMKLEIAGLKRNRNILEARAKSLMEEKKTLEARLNSLIELKKAIRVVKENQKQQKILAQKEIDQKRLAMGNRGYILKDRQFTMLKRLTIDVIPVDAPKNPEK